jgi:cell division septal protein FtsQ
VPSGRTIALLFAALATAVGLYLLARESSLFAVRAVEVEGAPPALTRKIDAVVAPFRGHSLVGLNGPAIERAVLGIPEVRTVRIDRNFPNTLRIFIGREFPVAILRRGAEAWLIAASNKVVRPFPLGRSTGFPRIWVPASVTVALGEPIDDSGVKTAIELLASLGRAGRELRLANVTASNGDLTLVTSSGIELRFGDVSQTALKLAVVEKILPDLGPPPAGSVAYLDVSVPSRPVSGTTLKSKVER